MSAQVTVLKEESGAGFSIAIKRDYRHLEKLRQQLQGLDAVVRDQVHRTLVQEIKGIHAESARAANLRVAFWSVGIAALCAVASVAVAWWYLPSSTEVAGLRQEHDELLAGVERLANSAGEIVLQHRGNEGACVCVWTSPPADMESMPTITCLGDQWVLIGKADELALPQFC